MDVREKIVELLDNMQRSGTGYFGSAIENEKIADYLIKNSVTVQKHGYLEAVVEVKDNTVCGNVVKIQYKRCSCCKNIVKFFDDYFCGKCGAKLDLQQPPKGE